MIYLIKKNRQKLATLLMAGLLSSIVSGSVFAVSGEPAPFDNFIASSGAITAGCGEPEFVIQIVGGGSSGKWTKPNGDVINLTCGIPTLSDGMLQRQVSVDSLDEEYNGTYIQFILTDSGATGDAAADFFSSNRGSLYFTGEDFIKMNNRGGGLATKQVIVESDFNDTTFKENRFSISTQYNMGWAKGAGQTDIWADIIQNASVLQYDAVKADATTAFELFDETVIIKSDGSGIDNTYVEVSQRMNLLDETGGGDAAQKFKHTRLSGVYNDLATNSGSEPYYINTTTFEVCSVQPPDPLPAECAETTPPNDPNANPLLAGGTNGGVIDWIPGNEISATWIGFTAYDPDPQSSVDIIFGLTRYENHTGTLSGNNLTELVSMENAEAGGSLGAWDLIENSAGAPMFGHAEGMVDEATIFNGGIIMTAFSVMTPVALLGAANLNYIANTGASLTPQAVDPLSPVDADYNQWTVNNGVFSAVLCPALADSCSEPSLNENGLYQRMIVVAGVRYYQTIMVTDSLGDGAVTGDPIVEVEVSPGVFEVDNFANALAFKNETFIKADNGASGSGLASRMLIAERGTDTAYLNSTLADMPNTAGDFVTDVAMNSGWANRGTHFVARDMNGDGVIGSGEGTEEPHAVIDINQNISITDNITIGAVSMEEQFSLERGATQADKRITMFSRVGTREGADGFNQPILFKSVTASGDYQQTARADISDPFLLPGDETQDLAWIAGDALQATWMGAEYATFAEMPSIIGTTSFANLTSGERIAYTSIDESPPNPDNWLVDPFLEAPSYP